MMFSKLERDLIKSVAKAVNLEAQKIAARARTLAPVKSGELRDSIQVDSEGLDSRITVESDHALPVEFGNEHMPAEPFLRPAFDNAVEKAMDNIARSTN